MNIKKTLQSLKRNPLSLLIIAFPLAILAGSLHWGPIWVFIFSAVAVIPLAGFIGRGTEVLAAFSGPKIGGLLNATLGNAAELIITLIAIKANLLELVKASITGSILGNLLFVLGASMLLGGIKNGKQQFDKQQAANHATLLTLTILALAIPSLFSHSMGPTGSIKIEILSLGVAVVMLVLYGLGLFYSLKFIDYQVTYPAVEEKHKPAMSISQAIVLLAVSTAGIVWMSELLVGAVEEVVATIGLSEFFLGIILIPIIGNVAEHLVAVQMAIKGKIDLSVEIAVSSSLQIALFVAPLLVFVSLWMGNPLTLVFNQFELIAMGAGIVITAMVSADGESNWLEGVALLAVYLILGLAFYLL
jgi:Ca2+:H+ antiporter